MDIKQTILIVDDSEINIDILVNLLDSQYELIVSTDGKSAIDIVQTIAVDLILLDIFMPDMDGYEVCKILKSNKLIKDIPIIFITSHANEDNIEKAYDVGGLDYILKPFKPKELKARIKTQLNLQEKTKQIEVLNNNLEAKIEIEVEKNNQQNKQILHQSRLAQMGEMINMIAHQWRQPLNAISLTSGNLKFKCMMDDYDKELFEKEIDLIDTYAQHLSKTIDDFRGFFKENKTQEITSLEELINSVLNIVSKSIGNHNIKLIVDFNCNTEFKTYSNELKQVILNIIKNAEDVLLEKNVQNGVISIETHCTSKNTRTIVIRDNAGGIPEDIINKIFEPYFSTKKEKDGTGLGLYMSKTIIEEHCGGKLSVENDNEGAVFKIELNQNREGKI